MADDVIRDETLDFLFDFVRDGPDQQLAAADSLDAKMVQVFSASAIMVGLAAAGLHTKSHVVGGLLAAAIVAFIVVTVLSAYALRVRKMSWTKHADELWTDHWQDKPHDIKHAIIDDIARAYSENRGHLKDKAGAMKYAIIAAGAEATLVGAALLWSVLR